MPLLLSFIASLYHVDKVMISSIFIEYILVLCFILILCQQNLSS